MTNGTIASRFLTLTAVLVVISAAIFPVTISTSVTAQSNELVSPEESASFSPKIVRGTQGETINISVSTNAQATVNLGSPENGFWAQVNVSGSSTISINTYATNTSNLVTGDGTVTMRSDPVLPLAPVTYDMNITIDGKEVALGKFIIEKRTAPSEFTGPIDSWIAPPGTNLGEADKPTAVTGMVELDSENNTTIAYGSLLAFRVNTSKFSDGFLRSPKNVSEKFPITFTETDPQINTQPNSFTGTDVEKVVHRPARGTLYIFLNTANHDIEPGDTYRVNVSVTTENPFLDHPEWITTTVTISPQQTKLVYEGDQITVTNQTTLHGRTTLPPGDTVNISMRYNGIPPFRKTVTATVLPNQTFRKTFDFSSVRKGDTFTVRLPDQGKQYTAVRQWTVRINRTGKTLMLNQSATITGETALSPGSTFRVRAQYDNDYSAFTKTKQVVVDQNQQFRVQFDLHAVSENGTLQIQIPRYNKTIPAVVTDTTSSRQTTTVDVTTTVHEATMQTTVQPSTTTTQSTQRTTTSTTTTNRTKITTSTTETAANALTPQTKAPLTPQTKHASQSLPGFTGYTAIVTGVLVLLLAFRSDLVNESG